MAAVGYLNTTKFDHFVFDQAHLRHRRRRAAAPICSVSSCTTMDDPRAPDAPNLPSKRVRVDDDEPADHQESSSAKKSKVPRAREVRGSSRAGDPRKRGRDAARDCSNLTRARFRRFTAYSLEQIGRPERLHGIARYDRISRA